MEPGLIVFIDEAGDPGVRDGLSYRSLRHEWLCLSAVVTRSARHMEAVEWVREMREAAKSTQAGALHYHRIRADRRVAVCQVLAKTPVKGFVLASHKSNVREYVNPRIGAMMKSGTFYNWCLRLLLERVTDWAAQWQNVNGGPKPLEVVLARRGHNYEHFLKYVDKLRMQKADGTLFLPGPGLSEPLLDRSAWSVRPAHELAGLQLADTVASAFYQAANTASPAFDAGPAEALRPIMVQQGKVAANRGVTVFPLPAQAELPEGSRPIFRQFGYNF